MAIQTSNFLPGNSSFLLISHIWVPHLADSVVFCACHSLGIVEVKCPYFARDMLLTDAPDSSSTHFCLECLQDRSLHLNPAHAYYYQCQLQLIVTKYSYCDFVTWTQRSIHVECMHLDDAFLENCLPAAKHFFSTVYSLNYCQSGIHIRTVLLFLELIQKLDQLMMKMMDHGAIVRKIGQEKRLHVTINPVLMHGTTLHA